MSKFKLNTPTGQKTYTIRRLRTPYMYKVSRYNHQWIVESDYEDYKKAVAQIKRGLAMYEEHMGRISLQSCVSTCVVEPII